MPVLAVFGGSFDPPHVAHVLAATYALTVGAFERLLVVPVYAHAFDKKLSSFDHRVTMCELAFSELPHVQVSRIEERLAVPSRTLATLEALAREFPNHELRLVIGSDLLAEAEHWHRFDAIVQLAPLFVVGRTGHAGSAGIQLPPVSSTRVRDLFRAHADPAARDELGWLVPRKVLAHAEGHGLYAAQKSSVPPGSPLNGP